MGPRYARLWMDMDGLGGCGRDSDRRTEEDGFCACLCYETCC